MSQSDNPIPSPGPTAPAATREKPIDFWFEGVRLRGRPGDSIAKALFDNGIRILSHSVKYGRPRGIHCGRGRCVKCHVEVDGKTGVKSCVTPLARGMKIRRQNYKPFYGTLMTRFLNRLALPAGFYYRVFTRPGWVRRQFVNSVRRLAGVGRIDTSDRRPHRLPPVDSDIAGVADRYDVVVVGAGVSGMAAALAACEAGGAGCSVLLVDEYDRPGGHSIGYQKDPGLLAAREDLIRRIGETPGVETVCPATAYGFYPPDRLMVGMETRGSRTGGMKIVSAGAFVFATGAQDVIPLFENNDLPGVFGARGLRLFIERDGLVPGKKAVVYGAGRDLHENAAFLESAGVSIAATVDASGETEDERAGVRRATRARLVRAEGHEWISRAVFQTRTGDRFSIPCDLLCVAAPGQPLFELAQQAGIGFSFEDDRPADGLAVLMPQADRTDDGGCRVLLAGEAAGIVEWEQKIKHAARAGSRAAGTTAA